MSRPAAAPVLLRPSRDRVDFPANWPNHALLLQTPFVVSPLPVHSLQADPKNQPSHRNKPAQKQSRREFIRFSSLFPKDSLVGDVVGYTWGGMSIACALPVGPGREGWVGGRTDRRVRLVKRDCRSPAYLAVRGKVRGNTMTGNKYLQFNSLNKGGDYL